MKRPFILACLALTLLVFALPAVASPPLDLPTIEAVGPAVSNIQAVQLAPQVAPDAINSGGPALVANYFETSPAAESTPLIEYVSPGTAPTLAGLMYGVVSTSVRETRIARDYYVSAADDKRQNVEARRWV